MKTKRFSIIEIAVVLFVVLILMMLSVTFYKTVQRSILVKNQLLEFENIKIALHTYKAGLSKSRPGHERRVNIFDLVYKHKLLTEKRVLLINGNDSKKANEKILSYFNTPIEVYVTKQRLGASNIEIQAGLKKINGYEYLTGDFELYIGREHELNGGEEKAASTGTPYGLVGTGDPDEANQYTYKFVFYEENDPKSKKHEYLMQ